MIFSGNYILLQFMACKVKKLAIFASHRPGFEIIKHLMDAKNSEISFVFLTDVNDIYAEKISIFIQSHQFADRDIKILSSSKVVPDILSDAIGASLIALTVIDIFCVSINSPSETVTKKTSLPL